MKVSSQTPFRCQYINLFNRGYVFLNNRDVVNNLLSRAVLLRPAFARNSTTHLRINRKLAASKPAFNLLLVLIAVQVRENFMPHHDEVDGGSESKKVRFHVGVITMDSW